jgi:hypothetical protein
VRGLVVQSKNGFRVKHASDGRPGCRKLSYCDKRSQFKDTAKIIPDKCHVPVRCNRLPGFVPLWEALGCAAVR